jgi:hypothetical protein
VPASLRVIETARLKYACPRCHDGVVEAPVPPQAVEKSLAGEGLLAHVIVSKYVDHLPLHRQSRIFLRQQVDLSRSTLCGWVADVATALTPIGDQLRRKSPQRHLQTDDATVTILEDRGSANGSGHTSIHGASVFDATTQARRTRAASDFAGDLQAMHTGYDWVGRIEKSRVGRTRVVALWKLTTDVRAASWSLIRQSIGSSAPPELRRHGRRCVEASVPPKSDRTRRVVHRVLPSDQSVGRPPAFRRRRPVGHRQQSG